MRYNLTTRVRHTVILLLAALCLTISNEAFAQKTPENEAQLKKEAAKYFENEDYVNAYPLYSQLLSLYPQDPNYNYRFGACMLYSQADKQKPLDYLEHAVLGSGVDNEAFYYIGIAYHLNYRFDDAIREFNYFKIRASSSQLKQHPVDRLIEMCNNAKSLLRNLHDLDVLRKKELRMSDYYEAYDLSSNGGNLLVEPDDFKTKTDKKKNLNSIIYLSPDKTLLFFASYGDDDKNGKDIYLAKRLNTGGWGKPQNLGSVVNTQYDEDYPFYDAPTHTLYFCSKGHNSMGGYDVFKSNYNDEANTWSQPVNMDFPINTPGDDILFVADTLNQTAFFSSTRSSPDGEIAVYKILIQPHPPDSVLLNGVAYGDDKKTPVSSRITVKNGTNNEVIGIFSSSADNGGYTMNLVNGGSFVFMVETPNHKTQSEAIALPTENELAPLRQQISYEPTTDKLIITNNFGNAAGDSSYLAAMDYIQKKALMNVNVDTTAPIKHVVPVIATTTNNNQQQNTNQTQQSSTNANNTSNNNVAVNNNTTNNTQSQQNNNTTSANNTQTNSTNNQQNTTANNNTVAANNTQNNNTTNPDTASSDTNESAIVDTSGKSNVSNQQLETIAYKDAKQQQQQAQAMKDESNKAIEYANSKMQEAQQLAKQAQETTNNANNVTDPKQKQDSLDKAASLTQQSQQVSKKAIEAFQLASQTQSQAVAKQQEADQATQYSAELDSALKSPNHDKTIAKLKRQRDSLEKQAENNPPAVSTAGDMIRNQARDTKQDSVEVAKHNEQLKKETDRLQQESEDYVAQAQKTDNAQEKVALLNQAKDLDDSKKNKEKEIKDNEVLQQQLHDQYTNLLVQAKQADSLTKNTNMNTQVATSDRDSLQHAIQNYTPPNNTVATNNTTTNNQSQENNNTTANNTQNTTNNNVAANNTTTANNTQSQENNNTTANNTQNTTNNNVAANNTSSNNNVAANNTTTANNTQNTSNNTVAANNTVTPVDTTHGANNTQNNANNNVAATNTNANNTQNAANNTVATNNNTTANNSQNAANNTAANNTQNTSNNTVAANNTTNNTAANNTPATNTQSQENNNTTANNTQNSTSNNVAANNTVNPADTTHAATVQQNNNTITNNNTPPVITYSNNTASQANKAANTYTTEATNLSAQADEARNQARQATDPAQAKALYHKADSLDNAANERKATADVYENDANKNQFASNQQQLSVWQNTMQNKPSDKATTAQLLSNDANLYYKQYTAETQKADSSTNPYIKQTHLDNAKLALETAVAKQQKAHDIYLQLNPQLANVTVAPNNNTVAGNTNTQAQENNNTTANNTQNTSNNNVAANNTANNTNANTTQSTANNNIAANNTTANNTQNNSNNNVAANTTTANNTQSQENNNTTTNNTQNTANNTQSQENNNTAANNTQNNANNNVAANNTTTANNTQSQENNNTATNNTQNTSNNNVAANNTQNTANNNSTNTQNSSNNNVAANNTTANNTQNNPNDTVPANTTTHQRTISSVQYNSNIQSTNSANNSVATTNNTTVPNNTTISLTVDVFQESSTSPYSEQHPIPVNPPLPEGLVYKIQVGAFRNPIPQDLFKGIQPIMAETTAQGFKRYTVGLFKEFNGAQGALAKVKGLGYKDAFIVAFLNGKRVPINSVGTQQIASNNSTEPNNNAVSNNNTTTANNNQTQANNNTVAPSTSVTDVKGLFYTVQVSAVKDPVPASKLYNLSPLFSYRAPNGYLRYNCGIYSNIPKANAAKDAIIAKTPIKDAFVVAYLNGERVSLTQASQSVTNGSATISNNGSLDALPNGANGNTTVPVNNTPINNTPVNNTPVNNTPVNNTPVNNTPPANTNAPIDTSKVVFSVQVGAYSGEIPLDVANNILKIASQGIHTHKGEDGITIYTVGSYPDYTNASLFKDELVQDGFPGCFVVAYYHGKKISLQEAQSLMNK